MIARTLSATMPTSTGTQTYTVAGIGTPDAILTMACWATSLAADEDGLSAQIGASDGGGQWSLSWHSAHNVTPCDSNTRGTAAACIQLLDPADGTVVAVAAFDSWTTDGVVLNWTTAPSSAHRFSITFFSGCDADALVVDPGDTAGDTITVSPSYSSETSLVFCATSDILVGFDGDLETQAVSIFGACSNDGTTVAQRSFSWSVLDALSQAEPGMLVSTANVGKIERQGRSGAAFVLDNFAAGGAFDLTTTLFNTFADQRIGVLALSLPAGARAKVYDYASPTVTGDTSYTDPGWEPQWLMLATSAVNAQDEFRSNAQGGTGGLGAADRDGGEWSMSWSIEEHSNPTDAQTTAAEQIAFMPLHLGGPTYISAILDTWDATGYTLNYDVTITSTPRYGWGVAIEHDPEPVGLVVDEPVAVEEDEVLDLDAVFVVADEAVGVEEDPVLDLDAVFVVVDELIGVEEGEVLDIDSVLLVLDELIGVEDEPVLDTGDVVIVADELVGVEEEGPLAVDRVWSVSSESVSVVEGFTLAGIDPIKLVIVRGESASVLDSARLSRRTLVVRHLRRPLAAVGQNRPSSSRVRRPRPQSTVGAPGGDPSPVRVRSSESLTVNESAVLVASA